jgi:hypothetical protein
LEVEESKLAAILAVALAALLVLLLLLLLRFGLGCRGQTLRRRARRRTLQCTHNTTQQQRRWVSNIAAMSNLPRWGCFRAEMAVTVMCAVPCDRAPGKTR